MQHVTEILSSERWIQRISSFARRSSNHLVMITDRPATFLTVERTAANSDYLRLPHFDKKGSWRQTCTQPKKEAVLSQRLYPASEYEREETHQERYSQVHFIHLFYYSLADLTVSLGCPAETAECSLCAKGELLVESKSKEYITYWLLLVESLHYCIRARLESLCGLVFHGRSRGCAKRGEALAARLIH